MCEKHQWRIIEEYYDKDSHEEVVKWICQDCRKEYEDRILKVYPHSLVLFNKKDGEEAPCY